MPPDPSREVHVAQKRTPLLKVWLRACNIIIIMPKILVSTIPIEMYIRVPMYISMGTRMPRMPRPTTLQKYYNISVVWWACYIVMLQLVWNGASTATGCNIAMVKCLAYEKSLTSPEHIMCTERFKALSKGHLTAT